MTQARTCAATVMDTSDPSITFDEAGVCHYVHHAKYRLQTECFRGVDGERRLAELVRTIRYEGRNKPYDCVAGISGGADSSYTLVRAKELGLRPLAVHLDNGWNSEVAVANIERLLRKLDVDLHTYVIEWEEIKDLQRAFFRASMSNVEVVTDHAITALLYQQAAKQDVRFILSGSNVETESIMPDAWGYDPRDARHLRAIHKAFGEISALKSYPILSATKFLWYIFIKRIRHIPLLNYGPYNKAAVTAQLADRYGWVPYARKHGESRFTRFFQEYYLPQKFGYDKRRAHLSSLIVSGQISREAALEELRKPLYSSHERELEIDYVIKKLGFSRVEWEAIMRTPESSYLEFDNNAWMFDHSRATTQFVRRMAKGEKALATSRGSQPNPKKRPPKPSEKGTICHLAFGPFRNESRALRTAISVLSSGDARRVFFVGYSEHGAAMRERPMPGCETIRLNRPAFDYLPRLAKRSLQWIWWSCRSIGAVMALRPEVIQCHSLASLPAAVVVKTLTRVPLIYDAHELETERPGWGGVQKSVARVLERTLINSSDHTFTVSESIANWYRTEYGIAKVSLLRNVPVRPSSTTTRNRLIRDTFGIPDDHLLFIYLGGIGHGRGYRQIISAFEALPPDKHIVFLGGGGTDQPELADVREAARRLANVHWHPPVPNVQVVTYAAGADVGISLIEDICLSYRYCLPNKLHECRLAGLPVIVSDLPEMARYVDDTKSGWKVAPTAEALRLLVTSLDREAIEAKLREVTSPALTWDDEQVEYLRILRSFLPPRQPSAITA